MKAAWMKADDEGAVPPPWSLEHSVCRSSERCTTAFDSPRRWVQQNNRPRGDTSFTRRFTFHLSSPFVWSSRVYTVRDTQSE